MAHVLLAGGSGAVGRYLTGSLRADGHRVTVVSRAATTVPDTTTVSWSSEQFDAAVASADAVVNLAGSSVGGRRWTPTVQREIRTSRVEATRRLVDAIAKAATPPVFLSASGAGFYGNTLAPCPEWQACGGTFLAEVTEAWEAEAHRAAAVTRTVVMRLGVVLDAQAGALPRMRRPMLFGVGGRLGDGRQMLPWIHRFDLAHFVRTVIATPSYEGTYNLVAPGIVSNAAFMATLGTVMRRPSWLPVPAVALRVLLGQQADIVLHGQNVVPDRLLSRGFVFTFPTLEGALRDLLA